MIRNTRHMRPGVHLQVLRIERDDPVARTVERSPGAPRSTYSTSTREKS